MNNEDQIELFFGGPNFNRETCSWAIWPGRNTICDAYIGTHGFLKEEEAVKAGLSRCWIKDSSGEPGELNEDGSPKPDVFSYLVPLAALTRAGVDIDAVRRSGKLAISAGIRTVIRDCAVIHTYEAV